LVLAGTQFNLSEAWLFFAFQPCFTYSANLDSNDVSWTQRLIKHKTKAQAQRALMNDAYVLATLEIVNQRPAPQKKKLLLITGTASIQGAAADTSGIDGVTFAEQYIRHPQAFLAAPDFFGTSIADKRQTFSVVDWLNLCFPAAVQEGTARSRSATVNLRMLRALTSAAPDTFEEAFKLLAKSQGASDAVRFPDLLFDEWSTQIRSASISRQIDSPARNDLEAARELLKELKKYLDDGLTMERIKKTLESRTLNSLGSLYSSTAWLGLWSRVGPIQEHICGIPALRFDDGYERAREYCQKVIDAMRSTAEAGYASSSVTVDIAAMYSELSKIDDSHYHAYVIHGLAYATKGHWYASKTLCRLALHVADGLDPKTRGRRLGREAAYLLAVSERRLAHNKGDLDVASGHLAEARARESPEKEATDIRFLSEALANEVARINFDVFASDFSNVEVPFEQSLTADALSEVIYRGLDIISRSELDTLRPARVWIQQQVVTNCLDMMLVGRYLGLTFAREILEEVRTLLEAARKLRDRADGKANNWDGLCEFIYLVSEIIFGDEGNSRNILHCCPKQDRVVPGSAESKGLESA